MMEAERDAVDDYLTTIAKRLEAQGLRVQTAEPEGSAADAILGLADEVDADLIAMTTHGQTGMRRLLFGSVAGEVLHRSTLPLLLVRVQEHPD
jgi:nucleotide-binding universal stress UspA family protein